MTDAISAAVTTEMFPPPPCDSTREDLQAEAERLLPDGVVEFDELYESANSIRNFEGPWPRGMAAALVVRGLIVKDSSVAVEYGEVVVRHMDSSSSTLTPAGTPHLRPYAEPGACRWCGLPRRLHRQPHQFEEPTDAQRLARMAKRRNKRTKR
ncbi:hypothetical protein [Streptomyces sp. NPDC058672]|uniref:hypothetical protein n=1 Tax=Streptomyces sp. NPDC058672 TaxID=3346591 RepID=UPI00364B4D7F